jgi:chromatin segregation and condensation protein Rec8/ScpA/Scc1 (kleisin family)
MNRHAGRPEARFPAVSPHTGGFPLALPPFPGFAGGWSGSLEAFLGAVRSREIPLEQAPLAAAVEQFLAQRGQLVLDDAGEFLHVAAALIDSKARLLLPRDPVLGAPDPRQEIVRTLAAQVRPEAAAGVQSGETPGGPAGLSLLDLMVLLHEVRQRPLPPPAHTIAAAEVTVADQLRWLIERLSELPPEASLEPQDTQPWFLLHPSFPAKICLFLALLELSKQGRLRLEQAQAFGPLTASPA